MNKSLVGAIALMGWLWVGTTALASHIPLPVKWSQLPDQIDSNDLFSMHALPNPWDLVVHEDWKCLDPRPVVAVRWWGSYLAPETSNEYTEGPRGARHIPFELSWHDNVAENAIDPEAPNEPPLPFSHPGRGLAFDDVTAQEEFAFMDAQGKAVYVYNAYLTVPWEQTFGETYWLDVALDPFAPGWAVDAGEAPEQVVPWGWSKAIDHRIDFAIQNQGWHWGPWNDPGDSLHWDRAFEIMVPEPGAMGLLALGGLALLRRRR